MRSRRQLDEDNGELKRVDHGVFSIPIILASFIAGVVWGYFTAQNLPRTEPTTEATANPFILLSSNPE